MACHTTDICHHAACGHGSTTSLAHQQLGSTREPLLLLRCLLHDVARQTPAYTITTQHLLKDVSAIWTMREIVCPPRPLASSARQRMPNRQAQVFSGIGIESLAGQQAWLSQRALTFPWKSNSHCDFKLEVNVAVSSGEFCFLRLKH